MRKTFIIIICFFIFPQILQAETLDEKLSGRILLQVESKGEAWYVDVDSGLRYFLGNSEDAFNLMRQFGIGISNADIKKIPEPNISLTKENDLNFTKKHLGRIFLQVESMGEAWYVNPGDLKRYYLGRPVDAFRLMRNFGLGISNQNLAKISSADYQGDFSLLEILLHDEVNKQREAYGLPKTKWNQEIAQVARKHSESLAEENVAFTGFGKVCDYPMIHHEDLNNALYNAERLKENNINYFSSAGENIALYSAASYKISYIEGSKIKFELDDCSNMRSSLNSGFKENLALTDDETEKKNIILNEINKRISLYDSASLVKPIDFFWYEDEFLSKEIVEGWMNSPGHKENIINGSYDESGMGVVIKNGYVYATQVFIERADCGYEGGPCCELKGYLPYCFVPLECDNDFCIE